MDIISLILIFILSQKIPILHDFLIVLYDFGVLSVFWISIVLIFTLATGISVVFYLPKMYTITCRLGDYHELIESRKLKEIFWANFIVGVSLFLVLIYIFNSVPTSFFDNLVNKTSISNTSTPQTAASYLPSNIAFTSALILVPTFLLSLRLLANPTRDWVKIIINGQNLSEDEIKKRVRSFKDQVTSFYYSFIAGTLLLFFLTLFLTAYIVGSVDLRVLTPFLPKMDFPSVIFFIVLEFVIVTITTLLGEWY